jgi:hypothetical protein
MCLELAAAGPTREIELREAKLPLASELRFNLPLCLPFCLSKRFSFSFGAQSESNDERAAAAQALDGN